MKVQSIRFLLFNWLLFFPVALHAYNKGTGLPSKPVLFVENKGQLTDMQHRVRKDIDFRINARGMNIAVGAGMLQYQWNRKVTKVEGRDTLSFTETYQMDVLLYGANPDAVLVKEEKQSYRENYYLPQCPDGVTAESYNKITYKDIYPHIDWVLYTKGDGLKYDFVVHPGGKVSDIKLRYLGDSILRLDEQGGLTAYTPYGSVREEAPYVFAVEEHGENVVRKNVSANFTLHENELGFTTDPYEGTLVIDPTVVWLSYYGGPSDETAYAVACQKENPVALKVYMAGSTVSYTMFATATLPNMVHQQFNAEPYLNSGLEDGFIAAFNTAGGIEWMTYYGGWDRDEFRSMICDANGEIYLGGNTRSDTSIATPGSWQDAIGGGPQAIAHNFLDGMLVKFDVYGKRLWGTYIGGNGWDEVRAIAKDPADNIYVTGETYSGNRISSPGSFKTTITNINPDAFLMKFTSGGQRLWGTYYGDDQYEEGTGIVCDKFNNVFLAGNTSDDTCGHSAYPYKDTAIATLGALFEKPHNLKYRLCPRPPGYAPPVYDGFLVKFDASGNRLWGTYYGGIHEEFISSIAYDSTAFVDADGKYCDGTIYIAGITGSPEDVATNGGWQSFSERPFLRGPDSSVISMEGFVAAITTSGKRLWGSYVGGEDGWDEPQALLVGNNRELIVAGRTTSSEDMATADGIRVVKSGGVDGFVAIYNQAAKVYGTYLGGASYDDIKALAINDQNQVFIVGTTASSGLGYHYTGQLHRIYAGAPFGGYDAFMQRLDLELPGDAFFDAPSYPSPQCVGGNYFSGIVLPKQGILLPGNTFTLQLSDTSGNFIDARTVGMGNLVAWSIPKDIRPGIYMLRFVTSKPLMISMPAGVRVPEMPEITLTGDSLVCIGDSIRLTAADTLSSGATYRWTQVNSLFETSSLDTIILNATEVNAGMYIFEAYVERPCVVKDTFSVVVRPNPVINGVTNNSPVCAGSELKLNAFADTAGGAEFDWAGPNFATSGQNVSLPSPQVTDAGMYKVRLTRYGCSSEDSTLVVIDTLPATPEGMSNGPLCHGDTLKLFANSTTPGISYLWRGPGNFSSTLANPVLLKMNATGSGVYTVTTKLGNCTSVPDSVEVIVPEPVPAPDVSSNSPVKEGDVLRLYATGEPGASYAWVGPDSFSSKEQNPLINDVDMRATGVYHVSATVNGCGSSASTTVVINGVSEVYFLMFPNPNDGTFRIKATMDKEQVVPIQVLNVAGQLVYETEITSRRRLLDTEIKLPGSLSSGKYHLRLRIDGTYKVIPFIVN